MARFVHVHRYVGLLEKRVDRVSAVGPDRPSHARGYIHRLGCERERFGAYATRTMGGNLVADLVREEVRRRERIVAIDDEAVAMTAYAGRVPSS